MTPLSMIKEHMPVYGSDGKKVGIVDHLENDRIKLTKNDSPDGEHHFISGALVDHVDQEVHLNRSGTDILEEWGDEDMELFADENSKTEIEENPELDEEEWIERRR